MSTNTDAEGFAAPFGEMIQALEVIRETMPGAREKVAIMRAEFERIDACLGEVRRVLPDLYTLSDMIPQLYEIVWAFSTMSARIESNEAPKQEDSK